MGHRRHDDVHYPLQGTGKRGVRRKRLVEPPRATLVVANDPPSQQSPGARPSPDSEAGPGDGEIAGNPLV